MWWKELGMFFFPSLCNTCGAKLYNRREVLCLSCEYDLPRTGFGDDPDNPVSQIFWGRVPVENATALLRFQKGSPYQKLLHDLKYRGNIHVGLYLGRLLGREISKGSFASCQWITPVPLHPKRLRERGYNQSEIIARGISMVTGIPVENGLLKRRGKHSSQTGLGRAERYENVRNDFLVHPGAPQLQGNRVLLVDDVVTTGSTLETCSRLLIDGLKCKVYIATVSYA